MLGNIAGARNQPIAHHSLRAVPDLCKEKFSVVLSPEVKDGDEEVVVMD